MTRHRDLERQTHFGPASKAPVGSSAVLGAETPVSSVLEHTPRFLTAEKGELSRVDLGHAKEPRKCAR